MKLLIVLCGLLAYACYGEAADHCYKQVESECNQPGASGLDTACNAKYGVMGTPDSTNTVLHELQAYVHSHITHSFDYLLRSSHFGNYQKSREGFEKLFRKLSDSTWDDAIDLIKYIGKRGGSMNFKASKTAPENPTIEINELSSLAHALDVQKVLALEAFNIHKKVSGHTHSNDAEEKTAHLHDPEVASFLENHFVHKHAEGIRTLSGHSNDLKRLLKNDKTSTLSLFLFDEYLQKL